MDKAKDLAIPAVTTAVLCRGIDPETRRYCAAVAVILSCFTFMLALSR